MAVLSVSGRTIIYSTKGQLFTGWKPEMHGCYGLFESYSRPGYFWIVNVYAYYVEFIKTEPMVIDDAFSFVQTCHSSFGGRKVLTSELFDEFE